MGGFAIPKWLKRLAWLVLAIITGLNILLLLKTFRQTFKGWLS